MAGSVPGFSLTPQFDLQGNIASGSKLYVIQAGTVSTPQNAYQDTALTILHPNPMTADAVGRIPQFFVADGFIKLRLVNSNGDQIFVGDNLLVVGPSSGGGGGGTVDPTTILATGDFKMAYGTGVLTGFVRANGRTIGNATSGATERANADTSALFTYLWNNDPNLAVSGGRGASAAADYSANKTIALPDFRGRVPGGLDDMGNTAAGRLTATYFGSVATVLGVANGSESHALTTAELAAHNHGITDPGHSHPQANAPAGGQPGGFLQQNTSGVLANVVPTPTFPNTTGITINSAGSGNAHANVQPTILVTYYVKL